MTGHAGSTPAHPTCIRMLGAIKATSPGVVTVYGGVYPTYHAATDPRRGTRGRPDRPRARGRRPRSNSSGPWSPAGTRRRSTCAGRRPRLPGRRGGRRHRRPTADRGPRRVAGRVGTGRALGRLRLLRDGAGGDRAVLAGLPAPLHLLRPARLLGQVAAPRPGEAGGRGRVAASRPTGSTSSRSPTRTRRRSRTSGDRSWRRWPPASCRSASSPRSGRPTSSATATSCPLYREAGILYVLMGIESTSEEVLRQIRKGSTTREDFQACRLLKEHGIFSIIGHIVGFEEETWSTFRTALRQLRLYGGDYLNAMYVTPHAWTAFGEEVMGRRVVQLDQSKWDYRHQILAQKHLRPWQLFLAAKWLELRFHLTPGRLWSMLAGGDRIVAASAALGVPAHLRHVARRGLRVPAPDLLRQRARDPRRPGALGRSRQSRCSWTRPSRLW